MKKQGFSISQRLANNSRRFKGPLLVLTSLALALVLSACSNKTDESKTAGQKLDSAIAKTEQAAAEARVKAEQSAAQAKEKTEKTFANAGVALKNATQNAESSAREVAKKAGEKIDDMAITVAVSSGLARDPELSALKIEINTKDGVVTLVGSAPNVAARERAGTIAKAVDGVQSVENKLIVKAS
jgi:hyperosmotically inducible periplasmic protein